MRRLLVRLSENGFEEEIGVRLNALGLMGRAGSVYYELFSWTIWLCSHLIHHQQRAECSEQDVVGAVVLATRLQRVRKFSRRRVRATSAFSARCSNWAEV
jgi:hypothetical protein